MGTALLVGLQASELVPDAHEGFPGLTLEIAADSAQVAEHFRHRREGMEAVIVGPREKNAIAVAQQVYKLDRDVAVLILVPSEQIPSLRSSLAFAPFISRQTRCEGSDERAAVRQGILDSVVETRTRRAHRQTLSALSSKLTSASVPKKQVLSVVDRLFELAPVGILTVDGDGKIEAANGTAHELLAMTFLPRDLDFVKIHGLNELEAGAFLRRTLEQGVPQTQQFERATPGGPQFLEATAAQLDEGGALVLLQDVTERVRADQDKEQLLQKLEEAVRMRDDFLSVASHELRTPLTSIMGWLALLRTGKLAVEKHAKALETIERNARAQAQLIEDMLDVSRIVSGKVRLEITSLSLEDIIRQAVDSVSPAAEAKGITLQMLLDTHLGPVLGDGQRLQQVVWNLLANAVKFTARGGKISVALRRVGSSAEIIVRDTGIGISEEFLPLIFERFRQAETGTTRGHGGLGLGLSIVRHFVELHGGTVHAESSGSGRGSTFTVRLPLSALSMPQLTPEAGARRQELPCPPRLVGAQVLLVEDEPSVRDVLVALLTQHGLNVTVVDSVAEGLRALKERLPDVIVSDIGLPHQDGYEFLRRVRELPEKEGGKVPALAMTAYAGADDRRKALLAGFQMHVAKPVPPEELLLILASLTGRI